MVGLVYIGWTSLHWGNGCEAEWVKSRKIRKTGKGLLGILEFRLSFTISVSPLRDFCRLEAACPELVLRITSLSWKNLNWIIQRANRSRGSGFQFYKLDDFNSFLQWSQLGWNGSYESERYLEDKINSNCYKWTKLSPQIQYSLMIWQV